MVPRPMDIAPAATRPDMNGRRHRHARRSRRNFITTNARDVRNLDL